MEVKEQDEMELYWQWLCSIPGLYGPQVKSLTACFGSPKAVYEAPEEELNLWKKVGNHWIFRLMSFRERYDVQDTAHKLEKQGINFISRSHCAFPVKLKNLADCPAGLFFRGRLPEPEQAAVAVVGARRCSGYGKVMAEQLGETLAKAGVQVISGLALGIDGLAQRRTVEAGGVSFGIMGCGVDQCYPQEHFELYRSVTTHGGIISEYPPGTPPLRAHFPQRNRIISGLADAVVVVEAREKSGSLITADIALEQGKDVYAVPGRSTDLLSGGCNRLIAQGAGLILSPEDLLENLKIEGKIERKKATISVKTRKEKNLSLAPEEELVYSYLDLLPEGLEKIAAESGLSVTRTAGILLGLQLAGLAEEISKNQYVRCEVTDASAGGEEQISINSGSQSLI